MVRAIGPWSYAGTEPLLGFAEYCRDSPNGPYKALALTVITLDPSGTRIAEKVSFVRDDRVTAMGFP